MQLFDNIKQGIKEDIENGLDITILSEDDEHIELYDNEEEDFSREYTIYNPNIMDTQWIKDRILVTPSAQGLEYKVDVDKLSIWLNSAIDKTMLLTLQNIVFIGDAEQDFDYLDKYSEEFSDQLECSDLPYDTLGIMWYDACKVFVNIGNIIKTTQEMLEEGILYEWEKSDCINRGIMETLAHEIRHLAQANPYLSEELLNQNGNDEQDAEEYARRVVEEHPEYLIMSGEEEEIEI